MQYAIYKYKAHRNENISKVSFCIICMHCFSTLSTNPHVSPYFQHIPHSHDQTPLLKATACHQDRTFIEGQTPWLLMTRQACTPEQRKQDLSSYPTMYWPIRGIDRAVTPSQVLRAS